MINLIVAGKGYSFERCTRRRWHALIHRHAHYLAIPLKHAVQVAGSQSAVLQRRMNRDLSIHLNSPVYLKLNVSEKSAGAPCVPTCQTTFSVIFVPVDNACGNEFHFEVVEFIHNFKEVLGAPSNTVERCDQENREFSSPCVGHQDVETGTPCFAARIPRSQNSRLISKPLCVASLQRS